MKGISATGIFSIILVIISTSNVFGKVVFGREKDIAKDSDELPVNPSKTELKTLSEEVLTELRSLDSSDTSARSFGFLKHKIAAIESKLAYLFSKILSPFAPVYIDVPQQDPYSSVYYRREDHHVTERPSIFSHIFKSPSYDEGNNYYNYQSGHGISKRSVSSNESIQDELNGESQGRTLHHIFPAFQNRFNYLMNRVFGGMYPPHRPIPFFKDHKQNNYNKIANPLEYQPTGDFDHGTSSQFHYQSPSEIIPHFLRRLGIGSNSDGNSFSDYLTGVLKKVQTPVVHQKHAESAY